MNLRCKLFTLCSTIAILTACNKSDNNNPSGDNNNNGNNNNPSVAATNLIAGKWQLSTAIATREYMGKDTTLDVYAEMDDCDKDDFILFASDGSGTIDENTNKCSDDSQVEHFTWALLNNDTRIALVDSNPDTFDLEVTGTQLKLTIVDTNSSGVPITWINTYKNIK